jgi:hypothetical protein
MQNNLKKFVNNFVSEIEKAFNKRENQIIEIDNFKFYLDEKDSLGLRNAVEFEPEVLKSLKKYVKKDANILDVGANLGYFTAHMSRLVAEKRMAERFFRICIPRESVDKCRESEGLCIKLIEKVNKQ